MWPTATIAPRRQQPNDNNRQHRQLLIQSKHRSFPSLFCVSGFSHEYTHGHERWTQIKMKKKKKRCSTGIKSARVIFQNNVNVVRWRCAGYLPFLAFSSVEWLFFCWSLIAWRMFACAKRTDIFIKFFSSSISVCVFNHNRTRMPALGRVYSINCACVTWFDRQWLFLFNHFFPLYISMISFSLYSNHFFLYYFFSFFLCLVT